MHDPISAEIYKRLTSTTEDHIWLDPVHQKYYFTDEVFLLYGPYESIDDAVAHMNQHITTINSKPIIHEETPKKKPYSKPVLTQLCGKIITTIDNNRKPCLLPKGHKNGCNPFK